MVKIKMLNNPFWNLVSSKNDIVVHCPEYSNGNWIQSKWFFNAGF